MFTLFTPAGSVARLIQYPYIHPPTIRLFLTRSICALIIVALLAPNFVGAAAAAPLLDEPDVEEAIKATADQPLTSTPLRLRRSAIATLLPVSEDAPPKQGNDDVLPTAMVNRLVEDHALYFFDEGRITSELVFEHDWQLTQLLVKLLDNQRVEASLKPAYLQGLLDLILADRHMAELAVRDAWVVVAGMQAPGSGISPDDLHQASANLNTAELRLRNGLEALQRGDADSAVHHFGKAWEFSARVLATAGIDFGNDTDGDGVVDVVELRLESNPLVGDTDGDGLPDRYELNFTLPFTLPTSADTDGDGIPDAEEDLDEDGLTNAAERDLGTDPLLPDTDGDSLSDGEEAQILGTDVRLTDTDSDGLPDGSEMRLNTDGRNPDSDGDGIPDGQDEHFQTVGDPTLGVTVELTGVGDHSQSFRAHSLAGIGGLSDVPGLVGNFVALSTELPLTSATVRLSYDPAQVPGGDFQNLRLFRYDPQNAALEILPNPQVDAEANEISAEATALSPVGVVHLPTWEAAVGDSQSQSATGNAQVFTTSEQSASLASPTAPTFPRLPICGDQDGSETPLILRCSSFVFSPDVHTYQVPGTEPVEVRFDFVFREAGFNNELGFFLVDSATGSVDGLEPGDPGYLAAAFNRAQVVFASGSNAFAPDVTVSLNGGDILMFFLVQNARFTDLVAQNPTNRGDRRPLAFFSLDALNPDAFDHFVGFEDPTASITQFGFEDLTGGGDRDYDDVVYNVIPRLEPLTGQVDLRPRSAERAVGETHTLAATVRDQNGNLLPGVAVTFTVTGANSVTGTATTDASGVATFSYMGARAGRDTIVASTSNATSNAAYVIWGGAGVGDSDHDGLTDAQETSGFRTQFGNRVFTDPFSLDTDADGIPDGDEVISGPNISPILSDPTKADTDGDGVDDFMELRNFDTALNTFDPDTDNDGLSDGDEVNVYGTDPFVKDTDGDRLNDGDEVREGLDPLLAAPRIDPLVVAREFAIGALCGEFCIDDPAHANLAFFTGFLISGVISVIPTPVTIVIGLIADLRDFLASLVKGDWGSLAINTVALIPSIGDAADVLGTVAKFTLKYPALAAPIVILMARFDWLPDSVRGGGLAASFGQALIDALASKGFDLAKLQRLAKAGVDLKRLNAVFDQVAQNYPGIADFIRAIPADAIDESSGILKVPGLTASLKSAASTGDARAFTNLIGNYGQWVVKTERTAEGWRVLDAIRQAKHANSPGYDLVVAKDAIVRLVEAKAVTTLSFKQFSNYVTRVGDELWFNAKYFEDSGGLADAAAAAAYKSGNLQVEIYINSPNYARIVRKLQQDMGAQAGQKILANYEVTLDSGEKVVRTVEIILTGVSK